MQARVRTAHNETSATGLEFCGKIYYECGSYYLTNLAEGNFSSIPLLVTEKVTVSYGSSWVAEFH